MATIRETEQILQQKREEISQAKGQVEQVKEKLPRTTQSQLRGQQAPKGLAGREFQRKLSTVREQISTAEQELTQAEEEVGTYEKGIEEYKSTEEGKLQYAREEGLTKEPIYGKIVKGGANEIIGYKYQTPSGEVIDYSPRERLLRQQSRVEEYEYAEKEAGAKLLGLPSVTKLQDVIDVNKYLRGEEVEVKIDTGEIIKGQTLKLNKDLVTLSPQKDFVRDKGVQGREDYKKLFGGIFPLVSAQPIEETKIDKRQSRIESLTGIYENVLTGERVSSIDMGKGWRQISQFEKQYIPQKKILIEDTKTKNLITSQVVKEIEFISKPIVSLNKKVVQPTTGIILQSTKTALGQSTLTKETYTETVGAFNPKYFFKKTPLQAVKDIYSVSKKGYYEGKEIETQPEKYKDKELLNTISVIGSSDISQRKKELLIFGTKAVESGTYILPTRYLYGVEQISKGTTDVYEGKYYQGVKEGLFGGLLVVPQGKILKNIFGGKETAKVGTEIGAKYVLKESAKITGASTLLTGVSLAEGYNVYQQTGDTKLGFYGAFGTITGGAIGFVSARAKSKVKELSREKELKEIQKRLAEREARLVGIREERQKYLGGDKITSRTIGTGKELDKKTQKIVIDYFKDLGVVKTKKDEVQLIKDISISKSKRVSEELKKINIYELKDGKLSKEEIKLPEYPARYVQEFKELSVGIKSKEGYISQGIVSGKTTTGRESKPFLFVTKKSNKKGKVTEIVSYNPIKRYAEIPIEGGGNIKIVESGFMKSNEFYKRPKSQLTEDFGEKVSKRKSIVEGRTSKLSDRKKFISLEDFKKEALNIPEGLSSKFKKAIPVSRERYSDILIKGQKEEKALDISAEVGTKELGKGVMGRIEIKEKPFIQVAVSKEEGISPIRLNIKKSLIEKPIPLSKKTQFSKTFGEEVKGGQGQVLLQEQTLKKGLALSTPEKLLPKLKSTPARPSRYEFGTRDYYETLTSIVPESTMALSIREIPIEDVKISGFSITGQTIAPIKNIVQERIIKQAQVNNIKFDLEKPSKQRENLSTITKPINVISSKSRQEQKVGQELKTNLSLRQLIKQQLKLEQKINYKYGGQKPKERPREKPSIKKIKLIEYKQQMNKLAKEIIRTEEEFEVFARTKGEDILIGKPKTKKEAVELLLGELKGTIKASGFIEQRGKKLSFEELGLFGGEFERSKVDPFRIVQRKTKRLSTNPETKEIQLFRKGRKSKWA